MKNSVPGGPLKQRARGAAASLRSGDKRAARSGRCTARPRGASPSPPPKRHESFGDGRLRSTAQLRHILGRGTLLTLHHVEFDALTLAQGLEATTLNGRVVDEQILPTVFGRDKTKSLRIVEPLNGT